MLLMTLGLLFAIWAAGVLVVVGMCRSAAQGDAELRLQTPADGGQGVQSHLRLIA